MVNHRPVLDALREPRYRGLWLAGLFANAARWMDLLVLGWVALELSNSPLMVGVAAFCRSVPMILGPLAGVLADRFPRGRVMVAVQATNVAVSATLALLFGTGHGGLGALLALEILLGILSACIGAQPLGTLWIGFATSRVGAPGATAAGAAVALALMIPVASRMAALAARPLDPGRER